MEMNGKWCVIGGVSYEFCAIELLFALTQSYLSSLISHTHTLSAGIFNWWDSGTPVRMATPTAWHAMIDNDDDNDNDNDNYNIIISKETAIGSQ